MIVGTAGHIDHGKTTLVRALTGIDTDRLPEERKRGISIELGYAFLEDPESAARIGFVDVPGHERFVHTMLAGASGIDYALLLVAADDGVMPQTREHLAVLSLLGIDQGAVLITKTDRAAPGRVEATRAELREMLAASSLADAPILDVSATTGQGLDALRGLLFEAARAERREPRNDGEAFRLAIDRSFSLDGVGTIVTGSIHAGRVSVGDELTLLPDAKGQPHRAALRVRSLHAQNHLVASAHAGQRCAVGLVGIAKQEVSRGQWLCTPAAASATDRLDLLLSLWPGEPRPLRSGTPVHVHLGARSVMGTVALLEGETALLQPGGQALAQLVLREPICAWRGDRVVLRDASASRTMAGGTVLDPFAPVRYRRTPARLAELSAMQAATPRGRLQAMLDAAPLGLDLRRFHVAEGLRQDLTLDGDEIGAGDWALSRHTGAALTAQLLARLSEFHARHPDELGPEAARLRRLVAPRLPEALWQALLARARSEGLLTQRGAFVHLPSHGVQLTSQETRIAQKVAPLLDAAGFEGAWVRDLARDTRESETVMRATLARLAQQGEAHQVVKDLYCSVGRMRQMAAIVRELAGQNGQAQVAAAAFRDAMRMGRKRAIQVLEYFDRLGLLRRVGEVHRLRADSELFL